MKKSMPFALLLLVPLTACTWVKPTPKGAEVVLVKDFNVTHCERLGATTARVKHMIGPVERPRDKVTGELITLAKNEAAAAGGDSIVARGPMEGGAMTFDIYRCDR